MLDWQVDLGNRFHLVAVSLSPDHGIKVPSLAVPPNRSEQITRVTTPTFSDFHIAVSRWPNNDAYNYQVMQYRVTGLAS